MSLEHSEELGRSPAVLESSAKSMFIHSQLCLQLGLLGEKKIYMKHPPPHTHTKKKNEENVSDK